MAVVASTITLACLWLCPTDYVQNGYNPPEGFQKPQNALLADSFSTAGRRHWPQAVEQWRPLVAGQFPPEQVEMALCVINGESGGKPTADNPTSTARGLWQFLRGTWNSVAAATDGPDYASGAPYDPEISTYYAAWLWRELGWGQWNAAARC